MFEPPKSLHEPPGSAESQDHMSLAATSGLGDLVDQEESDDHPNPTAYADWFKSRVCLYGLILLRWLYEDMKNA